MDRLREAVNRWHSCMCRDGSTVLCIAAWWQASVPKDFAQLTAKDYELDSRFYRLSPDVKTLVGYKDWMDSMADLVGCQVSLWRYLLRPKLFIHLCIGSLLPAQYRLSGP